MGTGAPTGIASSWCCLVVDVTFTSLHEPHGAAAPPRHDCRPQYMLLGRFLSNGTRYRLDTTLRFNAHTDAGDGTRERHDIGGEAVKIQLRVSHAAMYLPAHERDWESRIVQRTEI